MKVAFTLSMPNKGSWNGRWSGEGKSYVIIRSLPKLHAQKALAKSSYYYRWDDGWGASVGVREVGAGEARILKKHSAGFCGYDWMVDSIIAYGAIYADHQIPETTSPIEPCTKP